MSKKIARTNKSNEKELMKLENTIDTIIGKLYQMCSVEDKDLIEEIDEFSDHEELVLQLFREKFGLKISK